MNDALHAADEQALAALIAVDPEWSGLGEAAALTGTEPHVLLHAGPAFDDPSAITRPILNSACVAAVYEDLATDFHQARSAIRAGDLVLRPAQDYGVVTPLASVVSASMPLQVVRDRNNPECTAFSPLNGGGGPAMRLGLCNDDVLRHLRWLNGEFAGLLGDALPQPVALLQVAADAIRAGDDCHGRTPAATRLLSARLADSLSLTAEARAFLDQGPSFFLNLWMAACRCMLGSAAGIAGSSLVVAAGANGARTGIQVAGLPGRWFVHDADPPAGKFDDPSLPPSRALGAIGDSAIVDALGFGAMAMNYAPEQRKNLLPFMPDDGLALPELLLSAVHPAFGDLGLKVGMLARRVADRRRAPVVSLGILDVDGELGRLGGGIYTTPLSLFNEAVAALQEG